MLSGGQRKRVGLGAKVLIRDRSILLMDEAVRPLDAQTGQIMGKLFWIFVGTPTAKRVLFVTHDLEEAIALADRLVIMSPANARIIGTGAVELPRPRDIFESASKRNYAIALHIWRLLQGRGVKS